jgi:uncharacterized protein (DUF2235 family)
VKNIIFCSDGTQNTPEDQTNVWRTYRHLKRMDTQVVAYDVGVGSRFGNIIRGCIFGRGVSLNVREGFAFISKAYEAGDRIYLFGFSRGAYTVRSLASMISLCGLAPGNASNSVRTEFWKAYKKNRHEEFPMMVNRLKSDFGARNADIQAVCVWDTVGAIGRQTRTRDIRKKMRHRYHRMSVFPQTKRLYHAVSLDERRTQYYPHLTSGQGVSEQSILEEVWFAGVHSDIGGAFSNERSLGDIALEWMLFKVKDELQLEDGFLDALHPDPLGELHNVEGGIIFKWFRKRNRPVARGSFLHRSILTRINGPLRRPHQHREPSGNYCPLSLVFADYSNPPEFGMNGNYQILD